MTNLPKPALHGRPACVLVLNAGSSTIRFAVYELSGRLDLLLSGKVDRIGHSGTYLRVKNVQADPELSSTLGHLNYHSAMEYLLDWLENQPFFASVRAVGHRVVHGMKHSMPELVSHDLLQTLHHLSSLDPEHLPREISLIESIQKRYRNVAQVACFDTAFHRDMPQIAELLPIPRRYLEKGVERYGFHGLSYSYLMEELARIDPDGVQRRVILAHLGHGASMTAVHQGKSIDTSMGFTPASGLVMGSRTGDLDPGFSYFLARSERMTPAQFQRMVNHESGLLGVSGKGADMRDLLQNESSDAFAAQAVELFCYHAKKWIGALATTLSGLDTLVFSGGIGENAPLIRARICHGLAFLGIDVDSGRNQENDPLISSGKNRVKVRIVQANEELMIARSMGRLLGPEKAEASK